MKSGSQDKKAWEVFEIEAPSYATEAVEFGLNEADAIGTEINTLGKENPSTLSIKGYFEKGKADKRKVISHLEQALQAYGIDFQEIRQVRKRTIIEKDWLKVWKKHWKPVETEKFIISPPWKKVTRKDKQTIYIEPATAFGTGTHESTRLCLRVIEREFVPTMSFFDVGTGTGILSIAAAKLSNGKSPRILACDIDEESIVQAHKNASLNQVSFEIFLGTISEESPVSDFVCANLTLGIILPILPLLVKKTRQVLVLAGILRDQKEMIREALLELNIRNYEIETLNDWISVMVNP